ncbi:MAG TPA: hypothetical protein VGR64_06300, partial [Terracidiphilus sp.]|nr:hypothetical protein [Terracidiphilus sp.]
WLAAAAIVLAAVFGASYLALNSRQQANLLAHQLVDSHIRSLQPGHLFDVKSTDQHTVKPWFDGKLDFAPPVRDLAQQGFPLLGGRLDYLDQRTVAAMVYQRRQHLINEFVWPSSVKPANLPATQTLRGYHIICGWNHGMTFCAVSDVSLDELHAFVGLLNQ